MTRALVPTAQGWMSPEEIEWDNGGSAGAAEPFEVRPHTGTAALRRRALGTDSPAPRRRTRDCPLVPCTRRHCRSELVHRHSW